MEENYIQICKRCEHLQNFEDDLVEMISCKAYNR